MRRFGRKSLSILPLKVAKSDEIFFSVNHSVIKNLDLKFLYRHAQKNIMFIKFLVFVLG